MSLYLCLLRNSFFQKYGDRLYNEKVLYRITGNRVIRSICIRVVDCTSRRKWGCSVHFSSTLFVKVRLQLRLERRLEEVLCSYSYVDNTKIVSRVTLISKTLKTKEPAL